MRFIGIKRKLSVSLHKTKSPLFVHALIAGLIYPPIKCKDVQKWFWEIIDEQTKFLVVNHLSGAGTVGDVIAFFEKSVKIVKKKHD